MPALSRTQGIAQRVVCETNLTGLSTAMIVYANDYDDEVATGDEWPELLTTEYHDGQGCNVAFGDGHTEFVISDRIDELYWGPE